MRNSLEVSRPNRMPMWNMPDIDDMFDRAFRNPLSLLDEMRPALMDDSRWFRPSFDVEETDQGYLLSVDIPGVKKEDIDINISENVLTVSGERKHESGGKDGEKYERSYGRFSRRFTLPSTIEVDQVEANLEDGVLKIALPKSEKAKPRSIEVQSGRGGFLSRLIGSSEKKNEEKETERTQAAH